MKVRELIERLQEVNPEAVVVVGRDGEGNSFSPLAEEFGDDVYVPETPWKGDIYIPELTDELRAHGYTEEDLYDGDDGEPAVTLYPIG